MQGTRTVRSGDGSGNMLINEGTIWTPDNSFLLEYKARCECGEIVIGQELKLELQNLEDDFKNDRYFYNRDDALRKIDFMEHCVRLTKSPFYNKPMVLMLWQKAFIETLYSFKMSETSFRRFQKILLLIARKNGKSETCSGIGLTEFFLGNAGSDIVASSNDDAQASIIYGAIDTMRELIDPHSLDTKRNQSFIKNKITNTKVFKLSDRTKNKEGRNIDTAFLDESHEMKENIIGKSIEQSQSLKDEPLFFNITTEGFVVDGYLDDELKKARAVIFKEDPDDPAAERLLPWLYTQDSENEVWRGDRKNRLWMKSNPTLGTVKKWDYLEQQVALARKSKADRIFVLSKDFNIKQNGVEAWLNLEDYDYPSAYNIEKFRNAKALGAVDLSETTDLCCAKVLMMLPGDMNKYILTQYFIPETKLETEDDRQAGAKYKEWAEQGLITITEGSDIDLSIVADWFYQVYTEHGIRVWKIGYDQRFSKDWITKMEFYGWMRTGGDDSDLILILQNAATLNNAIRLCEADLKHQLLQYGDNQVDKFCFKNAALAIDNRGQCLIIKSEAGKRIDGAVCTAILYETYRRFRTEYRLMVEGE